jgi:hypothetical protein
LVPFLARVVVNDKSLLDLENRRIQFSPRTAHSGSAVWTWILPILAGSAVYFAFAEQLEVHESPMVWSEELLEVAPALLIMLLFQVFVLWPLRILFAHRQINRPLLFLTITTLIWIAGSVLILHLTNALAQGDPWVDASVIAPGVVSAGVYTLMNVSFTRR